MRKISSERIRAAVKELIQKANFSLPNEVRNALKKMEQNETSAPSKNALESIEKNAEIAEKEKLPLCQDTGNAVFFVELGHEVELEEPLDDILNRATKSAYEEFNLRKSIVFEPLFDRENTKTNTPVFSHLHHIAGDKLKITFLPKGAGAENKSALAMFRPADGIQRVKEFVVFIAKNAGGSACPPWIIGVGIGGTFDTVAHLAKRAILREIGSVHPDEKYARLEKEIYDEVQSLGIGAMGFSGKETVMAVHIVSAPCHIASLPVAVNLQCHSSRFSTIII